MINDARECIAVGVWKEMGRLALRCSGPNLLLETERFVEYDILGCIGFPENGDGLPNCVEQVTRQSS